MNMYRFLSMPTTTTTTTEDVGNSSTPKSILSASKQTTPPKAPPLTTTPPPTSSTKSIFRRRKRVWFSPFPVSVQEIPNTSDLSDEEIDAIWHSVEDYERFQRSCRATIHLMNKKKLYDDQGEHCLLGLETDKDCKFRRRVSEKAVLNVLLEQERQWEEEEIDNPERLAAAYFKQSLVSSLEAHQRGMECEESVLGYATMGRWDADTTRGESTSQRKLFKVERPISNRSCCVTFASASTEPPKAPVRSPHSPKVVTRSKSEHQPPQQPIRSTDVSSIKRSISMQPPKKPVRAPLSPVPKSWPGREGRLSPTSSAA